MDLRHRHFKNIGIQSSSNFRTYVILCLVRIILVFIPQNGYIHPDEFFQTIEVMIGDEFEVEHTRTWEFNSTFPIRSVVLPLICIKVPLSVLKILSECSQFYLGVDLTSGVAILIFIRFIMCLISFLNDWSIIQICSAYKLNYTVKLVAVASSFVTIVYGTRSFTNSFEMAISSVTLAIVARCMINSNTIIYKTEFLEDKYDKAETTVERVRIFKLKSTLPNHGFTNCATLATLCVVGVFNRPTFLAIGMPLVFYWLYRGMGTRSITFIDFNLRCMWFLICAIPSLIICTLIDSFYYGYISLIEVAHLDFGINNFVFTPWNFIKYNMNPENTAQHGTHPKYLHLLVNMQLLFNILGVTAICSFGLIVYRFFNGDYRSLPRSQTIIGLMNAAIFVPLGILSIINHQEPRFLLPMLVPIVILHASKLETGFALTNPFVETNKLGKFIYENILSSKASSRYLLKLWFLINILMTIVFGFLHQGGVCPLVDHFNHVMQTRSTNTDVHLITSHIYMLPQSLVMLPSSTKLYRDPMTGQRFHRNKQFFIYEYGGLDIDNLFNRIKLIMEVAEIKNEKTNKKYQIYLAIPTSLSGNFLLEYKRHFNTTNFGISEVRTFYPHLSIEAFPSFLGTEFVDVNDYSDSRNDKCPLNNNRQLDLESIPILSYMSSSFEELSIYFYQFGLTLYQIEHKKHKDLLD